MSEREQQGLGTRFAFWRQHPRAWLVFLSLALWGALSLVSHLALSRDAAGHIHAGLQERSVASGDEPHYLLVMNSILFDHDLELRDDYRRVARGSRAAGIYFRSKALDHHTVLVDPKADRHALWTEIYDPARETACDPSSPTCTGYEPKDHAWDEIRYIERSAHPVLFPAIVAAALAPFGTTPENLEDRAASVIVLFSWFGVLATYFAAHRAGLSRGYSLLSAVLVLCTPWLAYSRSYFTEPLLGVLVACSLWALLAGRHTASAIVILLAAAVKPPFVLVAIVWQVILVAEKKWGAAVRFATASSAIGIGLVAFNLWQVKTAIVAGNLGWAGSRNIVELTGTLVNRQYGLYQFVPWALVPTLGAVWFCIRWRTTSPPLRYASAALLVLLAMFAVHRNLGADCYGCRYWVPAAPLLAVVASEISTRSLWLRRAVGLGAVVAGAVAVVGIVTYPHCWNMTPIESFALLFSDG